MYGANKNIEISVVQNFICDLPARLDIIEKKEL